MSESASSGSSRSAFKRDFLGITASCTGVSLVTVAERTPPSIAAISPKWSPGTSLLRKWSAHRYRRLALQHDVERVALRPLAHDRGVGHVVRDIA